MARVSASWTALAWSQPRWQSCSAWHCARRMQTCKHAGCRCACLCKSMLHAKLLGAEQPVSTLPPDPGTPVRDMQTCRHAPCRVLTIINRFLVSGIQHLPLWCRCDLKEPPLSILFHVPAIRGRTDSPVMTWCLVSEGQIAP